jgi:hypothetical protein
MYARVGSEYVYQYPVLRSKLLLVCPFHRNTSDVEREWQNSDQDVGARIPICDRQIQWTLQHQSRPGRDAQ